MNFTERFPKIVYSRERDIYYYYPKTKTTVSKKIRDRIETLKIPKVYSTLWVNTEPRANGLLAIALDSKNRKQYYYSSEHINRRETRKLKRVYEFICILPRLRRVVARDMESSSSGKRYVIANVVYILENTYLRIGNKKYLDQNNSYGLTTLKPEFVTLARPDKVTFYFHGKHQVVQVREVYNKQIYDFVQRMKIKTKHQQQYLFNKSNGVRVTSDDINEYIQKISNSRFTCKDYRTYGANKMFVDALKITGNVRDSIESVSSQMGNTVNVLKKSYLFPCISETFNTTSLNQFKKLTLKKIIKVSIKKDE